MQMSNHVKYVGRFLIVDIEKPLFDGDYVSRIRVNKEYADKARLSSRYLVIRTPKGELIMYPKILKSMKTVKEVFKYPDNPMKMYELDIPHCQKRPDEYFEVS